jgi:6,7-dimethyl-8-ribityllumazine synthase
MSTRTENPTVRPAVAGVKGARILIVESHYYAEVADALIAGAEREIKKNGATAERVHVPGAFEIPGAIALAAAKKGRKYDGYGESARALMDLSVNHKLAVGYGIVTVNNADQAWARAATDRGDKGGDAAHACLAMVALGRRWKKK